MHYQIRILVAAIETDAAFELLDRHKKEFAGTEWMPANFFQRKRIVYILKQMEALYSSFEKVDFTGMPGESHMVKARYRMWLEYKLAKRWQVKDHMRFLDHVNSMFIQARHILQRLRRLSVSGQILRTQKPTFKPTITPSLLD